MELINLIVIIAVLVTFSIILTKILPTLPIFFAQIFLGILLGLSKYGQEINFEPELFLVMIIAPLLFREGKESDTDDIVKYLTPILFLASIGVLLTMLTVGFTLYAFLPTIPLAACLAFGAALGPTDAVAVGSLARRLKLPKNVLHILEGEGLFNDASGITAFQFAVLTLITGTFSLLDASVSLVASGLGGVLVGFVIIWIKNQLIRFLERTTSQDLISYLFIELLLPFIAYLVAEYFHSSGIIATVVAGVLQSKRRYRVTVFDAELANISGNIWQAVGSTLNALVFLFLGIELSQVFRPIWSDKSYANIQLTGMVLLIVFVLFLTRFVYINLFYWLSDYKKGTHTTLRDKALLTFGGVKGTISLATVFILPISIHSVAFEQRALLLFLTACVIFISLLIGMIILPLLAEGEYQRPVDATEIELLQSILLKLQEQREQMEVPRLQLLSIETVISQYRQRIYEITTAAMTESNQIKVQKLQGVILNIEQDGLDELYQRKEISEKSYKVYNRLLEYYELVGTQQFLSLTSFWLLLGRRVWRNIRHPKRYWLRTRRNDNLTLSKSDIEELHTIYIQNTITIRKNFDGKFDEFDHHILSYWDSRRSLILRRFYDVIDPEMIENSWYYKETLIKAYTFERDQIATYEQEEKISHLTANHYRHNVNLLESYTLQKQI